MYADGTTPVDTLCSHFLPPTALGELMLCDQEIPLPGCQTVYVPWLECYWSVVCDGTVSACSGSAPGPGPAPAPEPAPGPAPAPAPAKDKKKGSKAAAAKKKKKKKKANTAGLNGRK